MNNNEFIKKYGKWNFKSIKESVEINLLVLYSSKQIPKYVINNKSNVVHFFTKNGKTLTLDMAVVYYMSEKDIIELTQKEV